MIKPLFQVENTRGKGRFGEMLALRYLAQKGYTFLKNNYCIRGGELDLIMEKDDIITFVEVKLRSGKKFGRGLESYTQRKKQKLLRAIFSFMESRPGWTAWQLDLIDIFYEKNSGKAYIQHFSNILDA